MAYGNSLRFNMRAEGAATFCLTIFACFCCIAIQVKALPLTRPYAIFEDGAEQLGEKCLTAHSEAPASAIKLRRLTARLAAQESEDYDDYESADQAFADDYHNHNQQDIENLLQAGQLQLFEVIDSENGADFEGEGEKESDNLDDIGQLDDDGRTSGKRPWRKVKRIIRRQLKKPKRYLKKLIRQVGLRRQLRSNSFMLVPLEEPAGHKADVLMQEEPAINAHHDNAAAAEQPAVVEEMFLLNPQ